jgi:hypothetical protein
LFEIALSVVSMAFGFEIIVVVGFFNDLFGHALNLLRPFGHSCRQWAL